MSYQARIAMPPLIVTGRTGACGNTKRTGRVRALRSCGTIGAKSFPSAPSPCSQITACSGSGPVSVTTHSRSCCSEEVMRRILPVLRALLFAMLCTAIVLIAGGCGLKGDLVMPDAQQAPNPDAPRPEPDDVDA